eukprot:4658403-Amphidinium_carterae.4
MDDRQVDESPGRVTESDRIDQAMEEKAGETVDEGLINPIMVNDSSHENFSSDFGGGVLHDRHPHAESALQGTIPCGCGGSKRLSSAQ